MQLIVDSVALVIGVRSEYRGPCRNASAAPNSSNPQHCIAGDGHGSSNCNWPESRNRFLDQQLLAFDPSQLHRVWSRPFQLSGELGF